MRLRPQLMLFLVLLGACFGGNSGGDLSRICQAMVECGQIASSQEVCEEELERIVPSGAVRSTQECADCWATATCSELRTGGCSESCAAFSDSLTYVPGKVTSPCNGNSDENYASADRDGNLRVVIGSCQGSIRVVPGPYFEVGDMMDCGAFSQNGGTCPQAVGTMSIRDVGGQRWVSGGCFCSDTQLSFDVPFRVAL